ncbi:MAG: hypothetical protein KGL59_04840 [Acidobacteriota bacterium]|nr:hypothetical protein [Acidobacteriota bacterium]
MRKMLVLLSVSVFCAQGLARQKSVDDLRHQAWKYQRAGEKEYQAGNCGRSLKDNLKAVELTDQAIAFGARMGHGHELLQIGNCYADGGDSQKALQYYKREAPSGTISANSETEARLGFASWLGKVIANCPTCSYNLIHWDTLAHVYRLMGDNDKATRTAAEFDLHRQANAAYEEQNRKGGGMHFMDYLGMATGSAAAMGAARNGTPPPDVSNLPHSDTGAEITKANNRAWYAKMMVYKNANRPEYVTQVVQEMRNYNSRQ